MTKLPGQGSDPCRYNTLAAGACLLAVLACGVACAVKFYNFGYFDWDLAIYTQAMHRLLHGGAGVSLAGWNIFGDHSVFVILSLLPFFAVVPHALTLVFAKIAVYGLSGFLIYRFAAGRTGGAAALLLTIIYLIFPPNIFAVLYEFNAENLAPVFLVLLYAFFVRGQWRPFLLVAALTLLIKESMGLVIAGFGVWGLLVKRADRLRWGVVPFVAGLGTTILLISVIMPHLRGADYGYVFRYRHLGDSVGAILTTVVTQPQTVAAYLTDPRNIDYLVLLFGPMMVPALCNPLGLLPALPLLLQHMLSLHPSEHEIYYYYNSCIVPFIFLAGIETLGWLRRQLRVCDSRRKEAAFFGIVVLLAAFALVSVVQFGKAMALRVRVGHRPFVALRWDLLSALSPQDNVVATFDYLSPLAVRDNLYSFHKVYDEAYHDPQKLRRNTFASGQPFRLPPDVTCAVIDFADGWLLRALAGDDGAKVRERVRDFYENSDWRVRDAVGTLILLERSGSGGPKLTTREPGPAAASVGVSEIAIEDKFRVARVEVQDARRRQEALVIPVVMTFQAMTDIDESYGVRFFLVRDGHETVSETFSLGYTVYPTEIWRDGDVIEDRYWPVFSAPGSGPFTLRMEFVRSEGEDAVKAGEPMWDTTVAINPE